MSIGQKPDIGSAKDFVPSCLTACAVRGDASDPLVARAFPAPDRQYRNAFQRDRERIVQSRAFRRLAGKTQVFTSGSSDHFRSRLTHTIEVAQIARNIAQALGLNEDLAETLALVHDIGHPPFGHAGERALDRCLRRHGLSFDHNLHALRIVEYFELRYAAHRGLNLTLGVREGIIKHSRDYIKAQHPDLSEYFLDLRPPLEAQLIDLADEIAYLTADLDDGLDSGMLQLGNVLENVDILNRCYRRVEREHAGVEPKYLVHEALQLMMHALSEDLIHQIAATTLGAGITDLASVRAYPERIATLSPAMELERRNEKRYLYESLYTSEILTREHDRAETVVTELFDYWMADPERLPASYYSECAETGAPRVITDYIAGMTDSFILDQYEQFEAATK
jgi:dGTPase